MSDKIDNQTNSASQKEAAHHSQQERIRGGDIPHIVAFAFTACYVLGPAVAAFGGFIGYSSDHNGYALLSIICGTVLILVGVVLHFIAARQAEESDLHIFARSPLPPNIIARRPELSVDKTEIVLAINQAPRISLEITNRGAITAHNLKLPRCNMMQEAPFAGPLPKCDMEFGDIYPDIAPGATISAFAIWEKYLNREFYSHVQSGRLLLFHYFKGHYEDDSGNIYQLNRVYIYEPAIGNLRIAPKQYWPKDDNGE